MTSKSLAIALLAGLAAPAALGQVVINEVIQDPPGSDQEWEFIELYGRPGMSLDGYAVAVYKGGSDTNDDGVPNSPTEVDEAFSLDGLSLGSNGILVLLNNRTGAPESSLFVAPDANVGGFAEAHIPGNDTQGQLANGESSTYLLVRARPNYRFENGESVYLDGYSFLKDAVPDADFDGKLDFGFETASAQQQDPLQIVDDLAWSDDGGKEYVRSSDQEISDTPGFDPDSVSRLNYFGTNPMLGDRINGSGEIVSTRSADEEWVYGEIVRLPLTLDDLPEYGSQAAGTDAGVFPKGPTDQDGPLYDCPPGAMTEGDCIISPTGTILFDDIQLVQDAGTASEVGFNITPGGFNDDSRLGITQFRFVLADFDFDGDADSDDLAFIQSKVGVTLDDTITCLDADTGMPIMDPTTMATFDCFEYQGRSFNAIEAMRSMDLTDGVGGENADEVTPDDVAAAAMLIPASRLCADSNDDGLVNGLDFGAWLGAFNAQSPIADVNQDDVINGLDFGAWLGAFNLGIAGPTCSP